MRYITLFTALIFFIISCGTTYENLTFFSMGTVVTITAEKGRVQQKEMKTYIDNRAMSIMMETEEVNTAQTGKPVRLSKEFHSLVTNGFYFYKLTDGRMDITIKSLLAAYGFPEGPFSIPSEADLEKAKNSVGLHQIEEKDNSIIRKTNVVTIDTGAYSKGFIVDRSIEYLMQDGIKNAIVNAGGDLYALGDKDGKPWRVAVVHPAKKGGYISIVKLKDMALATSGDYERFFEQDGQYIHHIFDAKTKMPAKLYKSVSVIAKSCETADGLATAYFLLEKEKIQELCTKLKTPVLLYTQQGEEIRLCGWESFEN